MMRKYMMFLATVVLTLSMTAGAQAESENGKSVYVRMDTTAGPIVLELWPDKAPETVRNFLKYVLKGHYDNTIFHRVIPDFMIQGGGMTEGMVEKPTLEAIQNEAANGLKNKKYTVAMARTSHPHSATSQFFINVKNNDFLDYKASTMQGFGYCVFGQVAAGKATVDKIEKVRTGKSGRYSDVPREAVTILKAGVIER